MTETDKRQNILRLLRHQRELMDMASDNCDRIEQEIKRAEQLLSPGTNFVNQSPVSLNLEGESKC